MTGDDPAAWQAPLRDPYPEGGGARPATIAGGLPCQTQGRLAGGRADRAADVLPRGLSRSVRRPCAAQAEASLKLAEQLSAPLATAAAQRAIEVLTKLAEVGDSAPAAEARTRALRRDPTACLLIR